MDTVCARRESSLQINGSVRFSEKTTDLSEQLLPQASFRTTVQSSKVQLHSDCHKGANEANAASDISPHINLMTRAIEKWHELVITLLLPSQLT